VFRSVIDLQVAINRFVAETNLKSQTLRLDRRPKTRARRCQTGEANVRVSPLGWLKPVRGHHRRQQGRLTGCLKPSVITFGSEPVTRSRDGIKRSLGMSVKFQKSGVSACHTVNESASGLGNFCFS
jgi:hypothetical protein